MSFQTEFCGSALSINTHRSTPTQIFFIALRESCCITATHLDVLHPAPYAQKALLICDVINHDNTVSFAEVLASNASKTLLACSVPQLQCHLTATYSKSFNLKIATLLMTWKGGRATWPLSEGWIQNNSTETQHLGPAAPRSTNEKYPKDWKRENLRRKRKTVLVSVKIQFEASAIEHHL